MRMITMYLARLACALTLGTALLLVGARPAAAQGPSSTGGVDDARKHYDVGLSLFDKEDYEPALAEFERAYQLAPSFKILYNTGKVRRMLKDYVGALNDFNRYMAEAQNEPPAKRSEVKGFIDELNMIVAKVEVTCNVPDADISIDDVVVGKSPAAQPFLVNPGTRKVSVTKRGYLPASQNVKVVPGDVAKLTLTPGSVSVKVERKEGERSKLPAIIPIGWVVTGVGVAGAAVFGGLALSKQSQLNNAKQTQNPTNLDSLHSSMTTFALVSDVFTGVAVVAGLASTYFTVKWLTRPMEETQGPVNVSIGPTGIAAWGHF
jgi:tetratricopeptide (TPR) repeat protein